MDRRREAMNPLAMKEPYTERLYREERFPYRHPFQRDRDRIIHSKAFRRLEHKTQVFAFRQKDHYRTRMTHTIEVVGIARTMARALGFDEDLAEAIAFAHDLGHPPFGHRGEEVLNRLMRGDGGFEHNKQTVRIVMKLEKKYPWFDGLNLTVATLRGLNKHNSLYAEDNIDLPIGKRPIESEIADYADQIAYLCHDFDDGLNGRYFSLSDAMGVELFAENFDRSIGHTKLAVSFAIRGMITALVSNVVDTSKKALDRLLREKGYESFADYDADESLRFRAIDFSPEMRPKVKQIKTFLHRRLYRHPAVMTVSETGAKWIERLFQYYIERPLERFSRVPNSKRAICDYIAGMTDRYLIEECYRYFGREVLRDFKKERLFLS